MCQPVGTEFLTTRLRVALRRPGDIDIAVDDSDGEESAGGL